MADSVSNIRLETSQPEPAQEPLESPQGRPPYLQRTPTADQSRICWICYSDSTEDDESTATTWRTPCPCALTAHEACLLDWVADLENPKNRKGKKSGKIQCPQCRSEIRIARPRSLFVDLMRAFDRIGSQLTFPGVIITFGGTLWAGAFYHGFQSIYLVFGPDDASRIFEHATQHRGALQVGLPLIPLSLIMSRTRYSEFLLPTGTVFLLVNQLLDSFELDLTIWPPSASTVFACLPLVRNTYCLLWDRAFGGLEKKWLAEIQPRAGQDDDDAEDLGGNGNDGRAGEVQDGDIVLEVNVGLDFGEDDGDDDQQDDAAPAPPPIANPNAEANAGPDIPPAPEGQQNGGQAGPHQQAPAQPNAGQLAAANANAILETSSVATSVLGALAFPAISTGMGQLLEHVLPKSWTTTPITHPQPISPFSSETLTSIWSLITGRVGEKTASGMTRLPLLQTRWGRTVIGGCLFIVVKDFVMLYWRYRLAKNHRQRRIMDWDRGSSTWRLPTQ